MKGWSQCGALAEAITGDKRAHQAGIALNARKYRPCHYQGCCNMRGRHLRSWATTRDVERCARNPAEQCKFWWFECASRVNLNIGFYLWRYRPEVSLCRSAQHDHTRCANECHSWSDTAYSDRDEGLRPCSTYHWTKLHCARSKRIHHVKDIWCKQG